MRAAALSFALLLLVGLTACTQFPQLDAAVSPAARNAEYPQLLPVDQLVARTNTAGPAPQVITANLQSRVASLRARAAALRARRVVDAATRARMRAGVS